MLKIAIIEDDQAISQMYRFKFEAEGYQVETADNGKLGLELVQNMGPDIILLDLMMPEMNGFDVAAVLAERLREAVARAGGPEEATFEVLGDSPPLLVAEDAPVHRALCELTGREGGGSVSFATDGGWLQGLGLDCVIWGPGTSRWRTDPTSTCRWSTSGRRQSR